MSLSRKQRLEHLEGCAWATGNEWHIDNEEENCHFSTYRKRSTSPIQYFLNGKDCTQKDILYFDPNIKPQPKEPSMNYSSLVFLMAPEKVNAVAVSYEKDKDGNGIKPFYTFKSFDFTLKAGDFVVVPTDTRMGFTICRVEETGLLIDPSENQGVNYKWIASRFDRAPYDQTLKQEGLIIDKVKAAEAFKKREELKKSIAGFDEAQKLLLASPEAKKD